MSGSKLLYSISPAKSLLISTQLLNNKKTIINKGRYFTSEKEDKVEYLQDEKKFLQEIEYFLGELSSQLEEMESRAEFIEDIEYADGVLNLEMKDKKFYVLNR